MLNLIAGVMGVLALLFGFGVVFGLFTGLAKLAFWGPLGVFLVLLLMQEWNDHRHRRS